jgi:hypothetical protein
MVPEVAGPDTLNESVNKLTLKERKILDSQ